MVGPLEPSIAIQSNFLPNYSRRDPADRTIIATARHTSSVLITANRAILDYGTAGYVKTMPAEE